MRHGRRDRRVDKSDALSRLASGVAMKKKPAIPSSGADSDEGAPVTGNVGFGNNLVWLSVLAQRRYAEICADHDLTSTQATLLCAIKDQPQGMGELAQLLGVAKNALSGLVDRMERRGLVQRETLQHDRRAVALSTTRSPGSPPLPIGRPCPQPTPNARRRRRTTAGSSRRGSKHLAGRAFPILLSDN